MNENKKLLFQNNNNNGKNGFQIVSRKKMGKEME